METKIDSTAIHTSETFSIAKMKDKTKLSTDSSYPSLNCLVCGDFARGLNFSVITCMSCKAFFRRNAFKRSLISSCAFEHNCTINIRTRGYCSPCRLKKCFALGMNRELIRSLPYSRTVSLTSRQSTIMKNKQIQLPTPVSLSLLRNDRSTLTMNEWTLLGNCLHAFDEFNPSIRIQCSLNGLSTLPPKLRLKSSETYNIVGQFFTGIQSLIEHSPDLYSLPVDARRALTKHNLSSTGAVNGIFLCRELDLYNNPIFLHICNFFYGSEFMLDCARNSSRCDINGNLIKIMLFIMTFSSNCSIVIFDNEEHFTTMSSSIDLIQVQNVYVTMIWKYLVYLYGFTAAVLRFSSLVKSILDIMHMLEVMPTNESHNNMVDTIVQETERLLVIKN